MRILLGTHHLEIRAGSELFNAELAYALQALGHTVAIFTFFKGQLAFEVASRGIPIFDPDDLDAIAEFAPEIIQTCHIPCAHFLRAVAPQAVRIHAMLSVLSALEAPPLGADAFSLGLLVSDEVLERVHPTSFGKNVELAVFPNWFDDTVVSLAKKPKCDGAKRVAVISNHIAPDLVASLEALEAAGDLAVEYFGIQRRSAVIDGFLLHRFDIIISIGRTPLLAAACGIPCIMADIHGSDGLLTIDNFETVKKKNFSGRLNRYAITAAHIKAEIQKAETCDLDRLRHLVTHNFSLSARVDWLLKRYKQLLAERRACPVPDVENLPAPSEGLVHADITRELRNLRTKLLAFETDHNFHKKRRRAAREKFIGAIKQWLFFSGKR